MGAAKKNHGIDVELGAKYRDRVSGWEGTATAEYRYMNGCTRVELSATDKEGAPKSFVFDVEQIERLDIAPVRTKVTRTGGPRSSTPVAR